MVNAALTSLALFGASVSALGRAHVVNKCSYEVFMCETPASGGGQQTVDKTLQPGESWDQQYTSLSNGAGWSIKLSKTEGAFGGNILQYEYTYQNDNMIWYDLSCVDGNPWDGNWEITSDSDSCNPKQQAYRYATDDAYGMQSCAASDSITVTLCSGEAGDDSPAGYSSASSVDSPASYAPASSQVAPASHAAPSSTSAVWAPVYNFDGPSPSSSSAVWAPVYNFDGPSPTATTFATKTTVAPAYGGGAVTITQVVTEIATATQYVKRHQHHPRGAHQHA
ncbi:uncharacterized protein RCC_08458 [Ramularia collo-cygni]|uniref:Uncharacterized protein n=1 Tax=Ramularia collo-cygni TaxID=112498 RepID=A0A2D3V454_9PEZI|nr:uncharacterized protein RCC_08458 [Ramularia collo-cygni]CZT22753.1 uncharacterized protein RCC_08458 [Ramularia collo-cygni]